MQIRVWNLFTSPDSCSRSRNIIMDYKRFTDGSHNTIIVEKRTYDDKKHFGHKVLGNHLLQYSPHLV